MTLNNEEKIYWAKLGRLYMDEEMVTTGILIGNKRCLITFKITYICSETGERLSTKIIKIFWLIIMLKTYNTNGEFWYIDI